MIDKYVGKWTRTKFKLNSIFRLKRFASTRAWRTKQKSCDFFSTELWSGCFRFHTRSSSGSTSPIRALPCGSGPTCGASSTWGTPTHPSGTTRTSNCLKFKEFNNEDDAINYSCYAFALAAIFYMFSEPIILNKYIDGPHYGIISAMKLIILKQTSAYL